jgi:V/A-type H+-transporting ATPase subunit I
MRWRDLRRRETRWRETTEPVRMERVAIVVPRELLRPVMVRIADAGSVELDPPLADEEPAAVPAARRLEDLGDGIEVAPLLAEIEVDLDRLVLDGRTDLLAGEASLQRQCQAALVRGDVAALPGWAVAAALPSLRATVAPMGGGLVRLPRPRGVDPPTLLAARGGLRSSLTPLVDTYGTVPYSDLDPTVAAGLAYVVMFGMMFGDVGHGLLLTLAGLALRAGWPRKFPKVARAWPFVVGAGLAATAFGFLYGEFFGPSGLLSPLWLAPMEAPVELLVAGIGVGAALLSCAYALGTANRWREGGWALALYAPSGIAGIGLFLGLGTVALGIYLGPTWLVLCGVGLWLAGLVLAYVGLLAGSEGGATGVLQAVVELLDTVIRVGSNLLSFARLAAFGLTHAALADLVWQATTGLGRDGPLGWVGAAVVFAAGNALAFSLEALVAAVQALRLEYYELFSRVFQSEGRPFRPWHIPTEHIPTEHRMESRT